MAGELALEKKALDIKILDLRKLTPVTDYFVICTANVEVQAKAIADWILENLEKKGFKVWHNEGYRACHWILLDYVDVVVHIFLKEVREFYGLEKLWGDAPTEEVSDEPSGKKSKKKNLS